MVTVNYRGTLTDGTKYHATFPADELARERDLAQQSKILEQDSNLPLRHTWLW